MDGRHPPSDRNRHRVRRTVNLKDWIKIALAIGLLSLGVQLYAGAVPSHAPQAAPAAAPR